MTQSDLLEQAAEALREAHTGEREGSGFTRARILVALDRERRRRLLRWIVLSPMASLLLVGSAWAQSTGQWPVVWKAVASVLAFTGVERAKPESARAPRALPQHSSPAPLPPVPETPSLAPVAAPPELAPVPPTSPSAAHSARARRSTRSAAPSAPSPAPSSNLDAPSAPTSVPDPPQSKPDADLALFRLAHDLHVAGREPSAAIAAYDEYLAAFPNGRFVPEARYNRALDSIKLGDKAGARSALQPFARGAYGDYRRKEARDLLEALH